jgi:hypothetical protein
VRVEYKYYICQKQTIMDLDKIGFLTQQEAGDELMRIIETNYNPCPIRNKKPCRIYFSPKLEKWFLTSKPKIVVY